MAVCEVVNLSGLLDEAKCFELVRQHRWPDGVRCLRSRGRLKSGFNASSEGGRAYRTKLGVKPEKSWDGKLTLRPAALVLPTDPAFSHDPGPCRCGQAAAWHPNHKPG